MFSIFYFDLDGLRLGNLKKKTCFNGERQKEEKLEFLFVKGGFPAFLRVLRMIVGHFFSKSFQK